MLPEERIGRILARPWMSDQCLHSANPLPPPPSNLPPRLPSLPQLGLIQLDQDDTNNWLKLETVCRPNDPYLTPLFCCDGVPFFPAPRSIWSGLPWLRRKCFGPNPPAGRNKRADIMRVMERLHISQMSGKLTTPCRLFFSFSFLSTVTQFHPFFVPSPPRTHEEREADEVACVKCPCLVSVSMTYGRSK